MTGLIKFLFHIDDVCVWGCCVLCWFSVNHVYCTAEAGLGVCYRPRLPQSSKHLFCCCCCLESVYWCNTMQNSSVMIVRSVNLVWLAPDYFLHDDDLSCRRDEFRLIQPWPCRIRSTPCPSQPWRPWLHPAPPWWIRPPSWKNTCSL